MQQGLLQPGHNCWRVEQASRSAFLVDAAAYFEAFRAAAMRAHHSIMILGWDIDSRIPLVPEDRHDGLPHTLGKFLDTLVRRRPGLHVHVLVWDYAMIYVLEREWLARLRLGWGTHRRLHFRTDPTHPAGASHHQKVIVIDDQVAFSGGMDLGRLRWDTPEHRAHDPRRTTPLGRTYPPYHDVQMLVEGPAARALGDLARERWLRATGETLVPAGSGTETWPGHVTADLYDVPIGIARTIPRQNGFTEVREVERLFFDSIAAARRWIYIENQYLTSTRLGDALARRLAEPGGPEVVMVLPRRTGAWLEQHTMDVLRARLLRRLRAADRFGRLRTYYPCLPELDQDQCLSVHGKVMVIDDDFARIGSANLSNRSLGCDTECDLALEAAGDPRRSAAIADLRSRLLAEHLGSTPWTVADRLARSGSLIETVEGLRGAPRTLIEFDGSVAEDVEAWVPDGEMLDPPHPIDADTLAEHLVPQESRRPAGRQLLAFSALLLAFVALAAAWRFTPLRELLDMDYLTGQIAQFRAQPGAPLLAIGLFLLGGLMMVPVSLLTALTVATFGPMAGAAYALVGMFLSAASTFGLGHLLGRHTLRKLVNSRVHRLSQRLAKSGVFTIVVARLLPVAPFSVINMVAGASHIRFRDFSIATAITLTPSTFALALLVDRLGASLRDPGFHNLALLALLVAAIAGAVLGVRHWLLRASRPSER